MERVGRGEATAGSEESLDVLENIPAVDSDDLAVRKIPISKPSEDWITLTSLRGISWCLELACALFQHDVCIPIILFD